MDIVVNLGGSVVWILILVGILFVILCFSLLSHVPTISHNLVKLIELLEEQKQDNNPGSTPGSTL